jgi:hypothetical protein
LSLPKVNPVIYTDDRATNQSNLNTAKSISDLSKSNQNGNILTNISLKSGNNQVAHKLGHELTGWYIVRQRSAATFFDNHDSGSQTKTYLYINSSADCIVDIYVF